MRKTYKCSNIKFCMEDENQRRTWEYLQVMTRKDGSYGKALFQELQKVLAEQIRNSFSEYVSTVHSDAEELIEKTNVAGMGQTQEPELSEDMMAFAFAMGE